MKNTAAVQKVRNYVLTAINAGEGKSPEESLKFFMDTFQSEYGHEIRRRGPQSALTEYLRGLPSTIDHAFTYHEIEILLRDWGYLSDNSTPKKVSTELENYWTRIAGSLIILAGQYNISVLPQAKAY